MECLHAKAAQVAEQDDLCQVIEGQNYNGARFYFLSDITTLILEDSNIHAYYSKVNM